MRKGLVVSAITIFLLCCIILGCVYWSCHEHGGMPTMVQYNGYHIPVGFSINRMDDGFYVVAISWKYNTVTLEHNGFHIYCG